MITSCRFGEKIFLEIYSSGIVSNFFFFNYFLLEKLGVSETSSSKVSSSF
jgi:hypothetical protein